MKQLCVVIRRSGSEEFVHAPDQRARDQMKMVRRWITGGAARIQRFTDVNTNVVADRLNEFFARERLPFVATIEEMEE